MMATAPANTSSRGRIFWLGAHKLLVNTELARLRELGFEVFNPPYLSHVNDQSADARWDASQVTTLPPEVFERLSRYNFFYNAIEPAIAELLNEYFDAVVVTIVARWAREILRTYKGPCVFRAYGQTSFLSSDFEAVGARSLIEQRDNFYFCPHSDETLDGEADWLRARSQVVPYCLSSEVLDWRGRWNESREHTGEILVTTPNIAGNPFHLAHYQYVKEFFYQDHFRLCGVQLVDVDDEQVVGSVHRHAQLEMFARASGYLYTYRDPRVCYLPPVEMMILGGPVAYLSGSLLARYVGKGGPGEARTIMEAHRICDSIRAGDTGQIREIVASQVSVARKYEPDEVWPVFDRVVGGLLSQETRSRRTTERAPRCDLRGFVNAYIDSIDSQSPEEHEDVAGRLSQSILGRPPSPVELQKLAGLLEGAGASAVVQECMRSPVILTGSQENFSALPDLSTIDGDGKLRNFVVSAGMVGVGRWTIGPGGQRWRCSQVGELGYLLYGPYVRLTPGIYKLAVRLGLSRPNVAAGEVDVMSAGQVVVRRELKTASTDFQTFEAEFDVFRPINTHEFRVYSDGTQQVDLESLTVERIV